MSKPIRVYAETSVFGGIGDLEFEKASNLFFSQVLNGRFNLVVSAAVEYELSNAPEFVRSFFYEMLNHSELLETSSDALSLQSAYFKAKIVPAKYQTDALHVALASVSDCAVITSWNFKHIVNFRKIALYNAVNMVEGYKTIAIHTPLEVISYED